MPLLERIQGVRSTDPRGDFDDIPEGGKMPLLKEF